MGTELKAYDRPIPFSLWPTQPTVPRPSVQSLLFAIDPWVVMRRATSNQVGNTDSRAEALAYIDQAMDFYNSASASQIGAAKPVQLYYAYLNIVKAFIICRGVQPSLSSLQHGLNEFVTPGGVEFTNTNVQFHASPNARGKLQAFDEYMKALKTSSFAPGRQDPITGIIPQILPGHRLWAMATSQKERFIAMQRVQFLENRRTRRAWLRMYLFADDLRRLGQTQNGLLTASGLDADFRKVRTKEKVDGRVEQKRGIRFGRHGVDVAADLAGSVKDRLWATVGSSAPYRRFYLYLCPAAERGSLMPQLASIYALTFYLGSLTRYRPNAFRDLLNGDLEARISDFVAGQAAQFVYLMASEFARRDVTRPSIV
jgi:hypothetical protein